MSSRRGFPFAKTIMVLAITFGIALGMCGLNYVVLMSLNLARDGSPRVAQYAGPALGVLGFIELAVMILTGPALVITVIVWVISEVIGSPGGSEPQKLFDDSDHARKNDADEQR